MTQENTHTPGPWIAYERPTPVGYARFEIHYGNDRECIAEVVHDKPNATLLAAAPDLLDALSDLLIGCECADETGYVEDHGFIDIDAIKEAARAAIAKAKGEDV